MIIRPEIDTSQFNFEAFVNGQWHPLASPDNYKTMQGTAPVRRYLKSRTKPLKASKFLTRNNPGQSISAGDQAAIVAAHIIAKGLTEVHVYMQGRKWSRYTVEFNTALRDELKKRGDYQCQFLWVDPDAVTVREVPDYQAINAELQASFNAAL